MAQVNEHFYERLTPEIIDQVIDALRAGKQLPEPRREADQWIFPVS
jgi:(2Fe-2S) ferredoxin